MKITKPAELEEYLRVRFNLTLPTYLELSSTEQHGIRVHTKHVHGSKAWGLKGIRAYSKKDGLSTWLIQAIGMHATKNMVAANKEEALLFCEGKEFKKKLKMEDGDVIVSYKGHILGLGIFKKGIITSKVQGKRARAISNDLRAYPGRNV